MEGTAPVQEEVQWANEWSKLDQPLSDTKLSELYSRSSDLQAVVSHPHFKLIPDRTPCTHIRTPSVFASLALPGSLALCHILVL